MTTIRQLTASDAERYWILRLEALRKCPGYFLTSYEDAVGREDPIQLVVESLSRQGNYTYGAFSGEVLVGLITLSQESQAKIRHRANIYALYVVEEMQGQGIGKALIGKVIDKARHIGTVEKINLSVAAENVTALRLYRGFGFRIYGYEEKALKIGDTYLADLHMVLHLK